MQSVYSTAPVDSTTQWGCLTPLQRCSRCIWQPSRLYHSLGDSYPSAEMRGIYSTAQSDWATHWWSLTLALAEKQSVYSTAPADWATHWGTLTPLQRCRRYILQPQPSGSLTGVLLPRCREVVGVFDSQRRLGHSLGDSYPAAKMQSVYLTAQPTRSLIGGLLPRCRDAVRVFYSPTRSLGELLPHCIDVDRIFYSPVNRANIPRK